MITVTIGLPGSGKTTWAEKQGEIIVSPDDYRHINGKYVFDKDREPYVWQSALRRAKIVAAQWISPNNAFIFDATSLTQRSREQILKIGKQFHIPVKAVVFCTPVGTCLTRDSQRTKDRIIGEEIIQRMLRQFQWPQIGEGFARVEIEGDLDTFMDELTEAQR